MKYAPLFGLLALFPAPASAETQLERLETFSERMNLEMAQMFAREVSANGGDPAPLLAALPDTSWDAEYRAAGTCILDKWNSAAGESAVNGMLDQMEEALPRIATMSMDELDSLDFTPDGITQDQSIEMTQSCGIVELTMQRMEESGFTAAMMQAMQSMQDN